MSEENAQLQLKDKKEWTSVSQKIRYILRKCAKAALERKQITEQEEYAFRVSGIESFCI